MSKAEKDIFEMLLEGGIIGTTLSALLFKNSGTGAALGSIAGAAILASFKATEDAAKTKIPLILEEDDALYEIYNNGKRKLIKELPKSTKNLPKRFTLK